MNHSHIIGNAVGNRGNIRNSPGPDPMACKESLEIIGGSALHTTRTQGSAREILSPRFSAKINPIVPQPWPGPAAGSDLWNGCSKLVPPTCLQQVCFF